MGEGGISGHHFFFVPVVHKVTGVTYSSSTKRLPREKTLSAPRNIFSAYFTGPKGYSAEFTVLPILCVAAVNSSVFGSSRVHFFFIADIFDIPKYSYLPST